MLEIDIFRFRIAYIIRKYKFSFNVLLYTLGKYPKVPQKQCHLINLRAFQIFCGATQFEWKVWRQNSIVFLSNSIIKSQIINRFPWQVVPWVNLLMGPSPLRQSAEVEAQKVMFKVSNPLKKKSFLFLLFLQMPVSNKGVLHRYFIRDTDKMGSTPPPQKRKSPEY